ncbi:hypothetical protein F5X68DRAFT_231440 [Plectosphaerella plurivora]|uniref:Uncharacterized protein n=1 Tax=Plectosphaerella plurivora TaxID=936078 RepID=A0A9P9AAU5_9PEZI|nr:hypothetical protein F5X68DRAFT_231440 [Plectosphaerella plurivora]
MGQRKYTSEDIDLTLELVDNYNMKWPPACLLLQAIVSNKTRQWKKGNIKYVKEQYGIIEENNFCNTTGHFKKINKLKETPSVYELLKDLGSKPDLDPKTRAAWDKFMAASADVSPILKGSGTFIDEDTGNIIHEEPGYYGNAVRVPAPAPKQPPVSDDPEEDPDETPVSASQDLQQQGVQQQGVQQQGFQHQGLQQQGYQYGQDMVPQHTMPSRTTAAWGNPPPRIFPSLTTAAWAPQPPRLWPNTQIVGPLGQHQGIGPMYQQLGTYPSGTPSLVQQAQAPGPRLDEATIGRDLAGYFHRDWKPANAAEAAIGTEGLEP